MNIARRRRSDWGIERGRCNASSCLRIHLAIIGSAPSSQRMVHRKVSHLANAETLKGSRCRQQLLSAVSPHLMSRYIMDQTCGDAHCGISQIPTSMLFLKPTT